MSAKRTLFFDGLPQAQVDELVGTLERRRFPAGSVVVLEGDTTHAFYVVQSGGAEVSVTDRHGVEQPVGLIGPGATIGEMAAFTRQPATATVRATGALEVLVLHEQDLERLAGRFPDLYRNLGAILADRLARTNRLAAGEKPGRLVSLLDEGAPALLAYMLAASVAWHTRAPTLLVVLDEPSAELEGLVTPVVIAAGQGRAAARADLMVLADVASDGGSTVIQARLADLFRHYEYVFVHSRNRLPELVTARPLRIAGTGATGAEGDYVLCGWGAASARVGPDAQGRLTVPEPDERELEELRRGRLSARGAAGRVVGWVARDISGSKVGVAFGAGSFRGYAHAGVLQVLGRAGLTVDYVAGTSIGAAIASLHAIGRSPTEIVETMDLCASAIFRLTFPFKSFLSSRPLAAIMVDLAEGRRIEDLPIPMAAVAADVDTQQEVVFRRGDLALAVTASISIPGIYPAQRIGSYTLVDGGVLDPVPTRVVADMGADQVIGVKLGGPPLPIVTDALATAARGRKPTALSLILRSIEIMQARIAVEPTAPTVFITPSFEGAPPAGLRRFKANGRLYVERGQEAAEEALPRLAASLPWLRA